MFSAAAALLFVVAMPVAGHAGAFDDAVLAELNFAREHPAEYARELQFQTVSAAEQDMDSVTDSGALPEAIDFLMQQRPLEPLAADPRLEATALDHVSAQGPRGEVGHGNFSRRLQHREVWAGLAAEDIDYGENSPREVVRRLIVDAGVFNRGHRNNIFGGNFQVAGVSCGPHSVYGSMCVIDFAGALMTPATRTGE